MKSESKRLLECVSVVVAALVVEQLLLHVLARRDLVDAVVSHHDWTPLTMAAVVVVLRLFLFFVAPGWLLYSAGSWVAPRWAGLRSRRSATP